MLAKLVDSSNRKYWYKMLSQIEYVINNVVHESIKDTPSRVLFGVNQRQKTTDRVRDQFENDVRDLDEIRSKAKTMIERALKYNKNYVDQRRKEPYKYAEGDYVMIKNFESTPGSSHKLIPQFRGPYKVVKELRNNRYVVADVEGFQLTQKPYQGVWEPANMRPWLKKNECKEDCKEIEKMMESE